LYHSVAAVFAALSIHVMSIRRSTDGMPKKLAEHRAQMCMFGLGEIQEPWPCGGWILSVFVRMLEQIQNGGTAKAATTLPLGQHTASTSNVLNPNMNNSMAAQRQTGQDVTMIDQAHAGKMGSNSVGFDAQMNIGQFSIDDSAFMLDMLNEPNFSFPGDLEPDITPQIPYFGEFSMLGI
jgi:hypothetical protein